VTTNNKEIETELGKVLFNASLGYTIQFPNGPEKTNKPRFRLEHEAVSKTNPGMRAGSKVQKGLWVIKSITDLGDYTNDANDMSEAAAALYPFGLVVPLANAVLRVYKEPMPQTGFPTEASWCLPLHVHYMVTGK